jgi:hypothetical protein
MVAAVAAVALVIGAGSALALQSHPPVQLFTYEEIATQYGMDNFQMPDGQGGTMTVPMPMPVMVMDQNTMQGMPFSPKMSCGTNNMNAQNSPTGACHDYTNISDHAFHSAQGMYQWKDTADGQFPAMSPTNFKPWTQSTAMYGKW